MRGFGFRLGFGSVGFGGFDGALEGGFHFKHKTRHNKTGDDADSKEDAWDDHGKEKPEESASGESERGDSGSDAGDKHESADRFSVAFEIRAGSRGVDVAVDALGATAVDASVDEEDRKGETREKEDGGKNKVEWNDNRGGGRKEKVGNNGKCEGAKEDEENAGLARFINGDTVFAESRNLVGFEHIEAGGGASEADEKDKNGG